MAGRTIGGIRALVGERPPVVRAMPNTPAAVRQGITVGCAGEGVTPAQRALCDTLLQAIGQVAWVEDEALLDPVTAVSGGGPAYVFLLAELLEKAAIEQGIPRTSRGCWPARRSPGRARCWPRAPSPRPSCAGRSRARTGPPSGRSPCSWLRRPGPP